jgi:hypothetical protein
MPAHTTLNVDDSADAYVRTATHDSVGFRYGITGLAPAAITYATPSSEMVDVTIQTGSSGDAINVLASGAHQLTIQGHGSTTVNLGGGAHGTALLGGSVRVEGDPGSTALNVLDGADTADLQVSYGVFNGQGFLDGLGAPFGSIEFDPNALSSLYILTGSGVTTFTHQPGTDDFPAFAVFDTAGGTNVFA